LSRNASRNATARPGSSDVAEGLCFGPVDIAAIMVSNMIDDSPGSRLSGCVPIWIKMYPAPHDRK
jgi:hypothetical protein